MEVFDVVSNTDNKIVLKTESQLQTLYGEIVAEHDVMIRWTEPEIDEDGDETDEKIKKSKLLVTEGLMARLKDGRFVLESEEQSSN